MEKTSIAIMEAGGRRMSRALACFFLFLLSVAGGLAWGQPEKFYADVKVSGYPMKSLLIWFRVVDSQSVEVTYPSALDYNSYGTRQLHVFVPDSVSYEGITYAVVGVGDYAFTGKDGGTFIGDAIREITLPSTVTYIGDYAFQRCTYLEEVNMSENIETIGEGIFNDCWALKKLCLPEGYTQIPAGMYDGCHGLGKTLTIPEGIVSIGERAFWSCDFEQVSFPSSLKQIGARAFWGCTNLTTVEFPASLEQIGARAFSGCGLTTLEFPASLKTVGSGAFATCTDLTTLNLEGLTRILDSTFLNCRGLTTLDFPEELTSIGKGAFGGCTGLTSLEFPASLKTVGSDAFSKCTGLTTLDFEGLTRIWNYAFRDCTGLTTLNFLEGLEAIGNGAFEGCTGLTTLNFPEGLETIGNYAFRDCTGLTTLNFPECLETIGIGAFEGCTGLTTLDFPDSLKYLSGFEACTGLTALDFPEGLETIGYDAFRDCTGLTALDFPEGLETIEDDAFRDCTGLTALDFPEGLETIGGEAFYFCRGLTFVDFPEGLKTIDYNAFTGCTNLLIQNGELPKSLRKIGSRAFEGCKYLSVLHIYGDLSIGDNAFMGCIGLKEVWFLGNIDKVRRRVFYGCDNLSSVGFLGKVNGIYREAFMTNENGSSSLRFVQFCQDVQWMDGEIFGTETSDNIPRVFLFSSKWPEFRGGGYYSSGSAILYTFLEGAPDSRWGFRKTTLSLVSNKGKSYLYDGKVPTYSIQNYTYPYVLRVYPKGSLSADAGIHIVDSIYCEVAGALGTMLPIRDTFEIQKRPLDVFCEADMLYGGTFPQDWSMTFDGFVNGEDVSVVESLPVLACRYSAWFDDKVERGGVGVYSERDLPVALQGGYAENYDFKLDSLRLVVKKAPLFGKVGDFTRRYGEENPGLEDLEVVYEGFVYGQDTVAYTVTPEVSTLATASSDAGTYALSLSGGETQNYTLSYDPGVLTVEKLPLVVGMKDFTRRYGEENPGFEDLELIYEGLIEGDTTIEYSVIPEMSTSATPLSDVGTYDLLLSGGEAKNYELDYIPGTLRIEKVSAVGKVGDFTRRYGEENPGLADLDVVYEGLVNGQTEVAYTVAPKVSTSATSVSDVGTYALSLTGGEAKNYTLSYEPGVLTVEKVPLVGKVGTYVRQYGEENPDFEDLEMTYEGLVGDGNVEYLVLPEVHTTAVTTSEIGSYPLSLSGGEAKNYTLSYEPGTLEVEKAEQEISWRQDFQGIQVGDSVELSASASSGLPVSFEIDNTASVSIKDEEGRFWLVCHQEGSVTVSAVQVGDEHYLAASPVRKSFQIESGQPSGTLDPEMANQGRVYARDRVIYTEGLDAETSVFTLAGILVYRGWKEEIPVPASGVYIVRSGSSVWKVVVM